MKSIEILIYEGCWAMNVFLVKDFFKIVSMLEKHLGMPQRYQVKCLSVHGESVISASGDRILADCQVDTDSRLNNNPDLVVVPAMEGGRLNNTSDEFNHLAHWLGHWIEKETSILSLSTGAYFVAQTGHADDILMATHWAFSKKLSQLFPTCRFTHHESYLVDRKIYTTGSLNGATVALLSLIAEDKGNDFAQLVASHLLLNSPKQLSPILPGTRNHRDEQILSIQSWIEQNYLEVENIAQLAKHFGFSERNLKRRFKDATQIPIIQYLQKVKIDKAKKLLLSTNLSIKEISYQVGYSNDSFFSRLFKAETGESPGTWRLETFIPSYK